MTTDMLFSRIDAHNHELGYGDNGLAISDDVSRYIVSASGAKRAYYTLWFFSANAAKYARSGGLRVNGERSNPYWFKQNLSISDECAINKALEKCGRHPIVFLPEDKLNEIKRGYFKILMPFGKYKDKLIDEVFATDERYCRWLYNEMRNKSVSGERLSKKQCELYWRLDELILTHEEELARENRENISSEYLQEGKIKDITFEVIRIHNFKNDDGTTAVKVCGKSGNVHYFFYPKDVESWTKDKIGSEVRIKSARVNNREIKGIKWNYLNYVKVA